MSNQTVALSAHNEIVLRAPPGATFMFWGADLVLRFQRGKEREVYEYLMQWMQTQVLAQVIRSEAQSAGVQPDYSGINDTPRIENTEVLQKIVNQPIDANVRCPMGCGEARDAHGNVFQNVNPACATHGNPDALYGRTATAVSDSSDNNSEPTEKP